MAALIRRPLRGRIEVRGLRAPRGNEPPNKQMFKTAAGKAIRPTWIDAPPGSPGWAGYWTISRQHLTVVAEAVAIRDGLVNVEMHYSTTEQCDRRCKNAKGDDCTCSCEGKNHGDGDHASWTPVGDTTLVKSSGTRIATRQLTRAEAEAARLQRSLNGSQP